MTCVWTVCYNTHTQDTWNVGGNVFIFFSLLNEGSCMSFLVNETSVVCTFCVSILL